MKKNSISTTQLAQICGVSQGTVDRALNNRKGINPKPKEKILAVANEYGYRPNIHARSMAGGKSMLIGVIVFDLNNQYFSDILMALETYCSSKGYSTVVMFTNKDAQREIECIQNLYHMSVDGIVLCPINNGAEFENYLLSLNIPIVTIGNKLEHLPYVGIDNASAMTETVESVLHKGYERLIYIKPALQDKNTFAQTERLHAFLKIMEIEHVDYTVTDFSNAENAVNTSKRNAFICPTDIYAVKLLHIAQKYSAGIIGFDNIRLIDDLDLKLDSVAYDVEKTARLAADYVIEGLTVSESIGYRIVQRGSI